MRTSHLHTIYESKAGRAKYLALAIGGLIGLCPAQPASAQATHIVRLEVTPDQEIYRFVPARITVRPGDVVRFKVSSGGPHNVAFDPEPLTPEGRGALNAAMPNRSGDLSGPVLDRPDAEYRIVVPALPPGHYGFFCTPHRAYDMRGELIVVR
ncbi:MAG TPA: plastocyanin/azurin family copper-binding protein [Gemmatimonadales bacterium]|jgi:plastocyanin|nr:plastocyanin/azurin family copper-binding protein [Gemmatimonadales bacterium]